MTRRAATANTNRSKVSMASRARCFAMTTTCITFVPERHLRVVEKRQNRIRSRRCLSTSGDQVLSVYEPKLLGTDRVAGIESQVIELDPKDSYRFAYKLWADRENRLAAARADARSGRAGAGTALVSRRCVSAGRSTRRAIANGIRNTSGWTVVRPPVQPVDMAAQGWQLTPNVAGFRKIRELRRPMASSQQGQPPIPVDQAVFSDGLATISVFVEPVEKNTRKEGAGNSGATHVLVKRRGDFWITLLGEVPQATLQQFASTIEYKPSK